MSPFSDKPPATFIGYFATANAAFGNGKFDPALIGAHRFRHGLANDGATDEGLSAFFLFDLGPDRCPQHVLLDLPGRSAREILDDLNPLREFLPRDP